MKQQFFPFCEPEVEPIISSILTLHHRRTIDLLLDNMRGYWQYHQHFDLEMLVILLDVVEKTYVKLAAIFDIISVQGIQSPAGMVSILKYQMNENNVSSNSVMEPIIAKPMQLGGVLLKLSNPDLFINELSTRIANEILRDLINNAATVSNFDWNDQREDALGVELARISGIIHRRTLRGGIKWIVASPTVVQRIQNNSRPLVPSWDQADHPLKKQGVWQAWDIYENNDMGNTILAGYRGVDLIDSGYFYAPYIPLTIKDNMLLSRCGKKLTQNGTKYYAKIQLVNYPI